MNRRPRTTEITGGSVSLIHDREVEARHLLAVQPLPARQSGLQRPAHLALALGCLDVLPVHQRGVRGEHDHRPRPRPHGELNRIGGRAHPQPLQNLVLLQRAHRDHGGAVTHQAPRLDGLHQQIQGRHHDQNPPAREALQRGHGGGERLPRSGRGHEGSPAPLSGHRRTCRKSRPLPETRFLLHLMGPKVNARH